MLEIDFLIVGQGLAGSAVAMRALSREHRILVIDEPAANRSSVVAAGVFNPLTGRRMWKTWLADELFPSLHDYYRAVETLTKRSFFHPMPLYRPFRDIGTRNEWIADADERMEGYVARVFEEGDFDDEVKDPYGGILLNQAGYLDTTAYLEAVREHLQARGAFREATFDAGKVRADVDFVEYEEIRARKIIFCQGVDSLKNPWFGNIPIVSLKGELITVQCDMKKRVILNGGVYMVPNGREGRWLVGATYDRTDKTPGITSVAREALVRKLDDLIRTPFTVIRQEWGVRPTTPDRKPIIGAHPGYPSMIIFNGFGTKGVSLAPYFSEELIRWMENRGTISKEADVTRFY